MGVDHAGNGREAREVEHLGAGGQGIARGGDADHFVAFDDDDAVGDDASGAVDDRGEAKGFGLRGGGCGGEHAQDNGTK